MPSAHAIHELFRQSSHCPCFWHYTSEYNRKGIVAKGIKCRAELEAEEASSFYFCSDANSRRSDEANRRTGYSYLSLTRNHPTFLMAEKRSVDRGIKFRVSSRILLCKDVFVALGGANSQLAQLERICDVIGKIPWHHLRDYDSNRHPSQSQVQSAKIDILVRGGIEQEFLLKRGEAE